MTRINSHPDKYLFDHVFDVLLTATAIARSHNDQNIVRSPQSQRLLNLLSKFHDSGKAHKEFQRFILDTDAYPRHAWKHKTHAPLGAVVAITTLKGSLTSYEEWVLLQAISGHHSGLVSIPDLIKRFTSDQYASILKRQIKDLDLNGLAGEIGQHVPTPNFVKFRTALRKATINLCKGLSLDELFTRHLQTQLVFSILLEADKALLKFEGNEDTYFDRKPLKLRQDLIEEHLASRPDSQINPLREEAQELVRQCAKLLKRIYFLTLPTGFGKTCAAACWAAAYPEHTKIVIVLPFLSITQQTEKVYRDILKTQLQGHPMMSSHSLATRTFDDPNLTKEEQEEFFVDTWRSSIVITTYDQFLLTLFSPKPKHQMRLHNLTDALIILDEVQTIPCDLWDPLDRMLNTLTEIGNSRVLAMSATLPNFLTNAHEAIPVAKRQQYFQEFNRYRATLDHLNPITVDEFLQQTQPRVNGWIQRDQRVLITVNIKRAARKIYRKLRGMWPDRVFHITADITPEQREEILKDIGDKPCLIVSTQCVEAGVDLDMDLIIRDFSTLDSIIQVSGRANRHNLRPQAVIEIICLIDGNGNRHAHLIYDLPKLETTYEILDGMAGFTERDVFDLCQQYFDKLMVKMDAGKSLSQRFARWELFPNMRHLLRGKKNKIDLLVLENQQQLAQALLDAISIQNRWERLRAIRNLAPALSRHQVSVYPKETVDLSTITYHIGDFLILQDGVYEKNYGIKDEFRNKV